MTTFRRNSNRRTIARQTWREYQASVRNPFNRKKVYKKIVKTTVGFFFILLVLYVVFVKFDPTAIYYKRFAGKTAQLDSLTSGQPQKEEIDKKDVQVFLDPNAFLNRTDPYIDVYFNDRCLRVLSSINISLQKYLLKKMDRPNSRYIGIVAMDPATGRILSMVGYDKTDPSNNPCLDNFPAASVFKIVTAAAAVEKCGFNSDSTLEFNGRKHTLYKSQLKNRTNKYTNHISFRKSFAQSVNPVFGKIGAHQLGKHELEKYARAFGFNRRIDFEIPVEPSFVSISAEPYRLAEIASGFNRETTLSPLHGALLASTILNHGRLIEPTIIDQIIDDRGEVMYRGRLAPIHQAISPEATEVMNTLMKATVKSGTAKKAFRGYRRDRILSRLNIGGKTGSIASRKIPHVRYDWFVGFAEEINGAAKIVISVVVAHEKFIGTRASRYARYAIKTYFRDYFAKIKAQSKHAEQQS